MNQAAPTAHRIVSRRAVVRAGAHAAWAVPAISVATAAPAFAAVSGGSALQGSSFRVDFNAKKKTLHVAIGPIKNTGSVSSNGPVTVVVSVPKTAKSTMANPYDAGVENNWAYAGQSSSASTDDYTFVSSKGNLKPNQSTGTLGFFLNAAGSPAGTYTYIATAAAATATAGTTTVYMS